MVETYFRQPSSVIGWRSSVAAGRPALAVPWQPVPLSHGAWPPHYQSVYRWRMNEIDALERDPSLLRDAKAYYRKNPGKFIQHWVDTYDPRKIGSKWMPFVFFEKQAEFVQFVQECVIDEQDGLTEKCRDAGATWCACGFSVARWLFEPDYAIGWGSRKQDLVDRQGDPDSIFEKMRLIINRLPKIWRPRSYSLHFLRLVNHENGSIISGEAGDNIGRCGRKSLYFLDEAAHVDRPEKVQAALDDNTKVQIHISSVNGLGNVFHRKREAGMEWTPSFKPDPGYTRVFIVDWRDHPEKTQEWYDARKAKAEREGLQHVFAQEVDRNYSAAIQNTVIPYEWITAAFDAHLKMVWTDKDGKERVGYEPSDNNLGGLDIADEGDDKNAFVHRQDIVARYCEEWGERDAGVATRRVVGATNMLRRIKIMYDVIGIGATVKAEYNRLVNDEIINADKIKFVPWNAGGEVKNKAQRVIPDDDESPRNKDLYHNLKSQAWFSVRSRFYKTWRNINEGIHYDPSEMISIDTAIPGLHELAKQLAQPTVTQSGSMKNLIEKKPKGTKSPNRADAFVMAFFPIDDEKGNAIVGEYGA